MRINNFNNYIYEKLGDLLKPPISELVLKNIQDIFQEIKDIRYDIGIRVFDSSIVVYINRGKFFSLSDVSEYVLRLLDYLSPDYYIIRAMINPVEAKRLGIENANKYISNYDITKYFKQNWIDPNLFNVKINDLEISLSNFPWVV